MRRAWLMSVGGCAGGGGADYRGQAVAIWFPISAFVAMGFEHSVANTFLLPFVSALPAHLACAAPPLHACAELVEVQRGGPHLPPSSFCTVASGRGGGERLAEAAGGRVWRWGGRGSRGGRWC